ncbi:hypothetical protein A2130_00735 [Candidatus Woesebacteria bacterium GWC2_33_12]|uniref:Uncharacterized protein n=1 Tax=Candidatus Woesebacteria bacterium GW2011_GWB1_33_22 TaxID=1618566 RepID=A0A0G0C282_9BACT|nr:MAG: hypothetical protein UR29_C0002G0040 [Candidatus Woesebacteria bacterium GW2011_GWC2_33_12]KKP42512.1 MAG: hypothetical protein UR33_C0002G0088 [Candidatus Woesebacteria bacterium GW2011_GWA2_33_20]KKP45255.1 MAG: hypothetical protein UR35_C0002G0088 [Candidatus Woesebacteria bacterium GW2011_GWB1_33_22]KKP46450.1 MAG: hypothetical protein UR37_C0007G0007 [Microgenomates group bacterium GW2011_GWC1_33_28]KKP50925.1 MAG: hypothetical protein UR41_C0002G0089 [Candidatus Woesebacteria bact
MEFEHPRLRAQREQREQQLANIQVANNWSREEMFNHFHQQGEEKAKKGSPSSLDKPEIQTAADYIVWYLSGQK